MRTSGCKAHTNHNLSLRISKAVRIARLIMPTLMSRYAERVDEASNSLAIRFWSESIVTPTALRGHDAFGAPQRRSAPRRGAVSRIAIVSCRNQPHEWRNPSAEAHRSNQSRGIIIFLYGLYGRLRAFADIDGRTAAPSIQ